MFYIFPSTSKLTTAVGIRSHLHNCNSKKAKSLDTIYKIQHESLIFNNLDLYLLDLYLLVISEIFP